MKLVVGLGNPGIEYKNTRHNVGFNVLDDYILRKGIAISEWKEKFNGLFIKYELYGEKVIFLKPLSFMNLSGSVVRRYVDFFKIEINDILIISDDLDLSIGNFRLRDKGSSGGHNGLKDIERFLNTSFYKRLKIGISNNKKIDTRDYVLGKFSCEELEMFSSLYDILENILDDFFSYSFIDLMNKYNRKNR